MKRLASICGFAILVTAFGTSIPRAGLNVGASLTDTEIEQTGFDADDSNWKIFGGWRSSGREWFGIEAQYVEFGDFSSGGAGVEPTSFDVFALGALGIWRLEIFGKAGVAWWDNDVSGGLGSDDSGIDLAYGVGATFRIGDHLHIRAEWEAFEVDDADLDMASLGIDIKF